VSFVWFICAMAIGVLIGIFVKGPTSPSWDLLAGGLASIVTLGCFVVQVISMARDSRSLTVGYAPGAGGRASRRSEPTL